MRFLLFVGILPVCTLANAADGEYRPYLDIQSISYSQPISIASMIGKWNPPYKGGDKAFTYNKIETGVQKDHWQLGIFKRYDHFLEFSRDTSEIFYLTENHLPLEAGKEYILRIKARHQISRGLRLGYKNRVTASLSAGIAASYLQGQALTDGSINGNAIAISDKDYDFQFDANYAYSRDVLFNRDVSAPQGNGYSLDLMLQWRPSERFAGQLNIIDLMGKIYWKDTPYTTATASSDNKTYDENGYVRYKPVISGHESNKDFIQALPRKVFISTQYQLRTKAEILAELEDLDIERFFSLGTGWQMSNSARIQGLYNITAKALTLRYLQDQLRFELGSDDIHADRARYLVLKLSYNQPL